MFIDLDSAVKRVLDISTAHITKQDGHLMVQAAHDRPALLPRIESTQYGWLVYVVSDAEFVELELVVMLNYGFSDELIAIYRTATTMGDDLLAINFDSDADEVDGLPTFVW